jgi:tetraacyldisaccharide 4'-kinase
MPESARLRGWLERRWYGAVPPLLLRPLAALYGLVMKCRRGAYARGWFSGAHPGIPVIVVGNLTVGGTGKTPLVMWLAEQLRAAGQRPGVVLRGYGGYARAPRLVVASDEAEVVGDEAVLIARRVGVPVAVGVDRVAAAQLLARRGCTLVLADDGLQHLALRRDFTIAVVDGARGFGNGALLPAGPLREPASMLGAVDVVVVNGAGAQEVAQAHHALRMELLPGSLRALRGGHEEPLQALRGATVHAVAGIGNPRRFFDLLRRLGARPIEHAFPDHHAFRARELSYEGDARIVMTEKDAVRCSAFATPRMWCLPVAASFAQDHAARLLQQVLARVQGGGQRHA